MGYLGNPFQELQSKSARFKIESILSARVVTAVAICPLKVSNSVTDTEPRCEPPGVWSI